jgi:hypothetical protein
MTENKHTHPYYAYEIIVFYDFFCFDTNLVMLCADSANSGVSTWHVMRFKNHVYKSEYHVCWDSPTDQSQLLRFAHGSIT